MKFLRIGISAAGLSLFTVLPASAGSLNPGSWKDQYVGRDSFQVYYDFFEANEVAVIAVKGDGSSDIDLWIYDEHDNLVAKSTSDDCYEQVSFRPVWTGAFKIVVENRYKPDGSSFQLITN